MKIKEKEKPDMLDTREKLWELQEEALKQSRAVENWYWKKAYEDLAMALDVLDAFIARSDCNE